MKNSIKTMLLVSLLTLSGTVFANSVDGINGAVDGANTAPIWSQESQAEWASNRAGSATPIQIIKKIYNFNGNLQYRVTGVTQYIDENGHNSTDHNYSVYNSNNMHLGSWVVSCEDISNSCEAHPVYYK